MREDYLMLFDRDLPERLAEPFKKQVKERICRWCGADLSKEPIKHYGPHSGGWTVPGYDEPRWLYIVCPSCKYQWALWKLGVKRERY